VKVGEHRYLYDRDNDNCHPLLRHVDVMAPTYTDLCQELASDGSSCSIAALVALSGVLSIRINSYYPPLQATFVSPLTTEIIGRGVSTSVVSVTNQRHVVIRFVSGRR